jgi:hypothetical protein
MNRQMRRELARREYHKVQSTTPQRLTLSEASKIEKKYYELEELRKAHQIGFVRGMEAMYEMALQSVSEVKGIGAKRMEQIHHAVKDGILKYAKEVGVEI